MLPTIGESSKLPTNCRETGGKDFIVAHPNCDEEALIVALLRGAFEFQGQKCSAASRAYIPESVWSRIEAKYVEEVGKITMGDVADFSNFIGAVIDKKSFDNITGYIDRAHADSGCSIVTGGSYDGSKGYFVEPTTIVCSDPMYESMQEEIFGPVLSIHVYEDSKFEEILTICDSTSEYALTGSIFATNREDIETAKDALRFSAGNFYINDKPTGAVVGQQPFGGAAEAVQTTRQEVHSTCFDGFHHVPSRRRSRLQETGAMASLSDAAIGLLPQVHSVPSVSVAHHVDFLL